MDKTTFTVAELLDAAKKGGHKWSSHGAGSSLKNESYCLLEQVALNVGLKPHNWVNISDALNTLSPVDADDGRGIGEQLWIYNDDVATSYDQAVRHMKKIVAEYINRRVEVIL